MHCIIYVCLKENTYKIIQYPAYTMLSSQHSQYVFEQVIPVGSSSQPRQLGLAKSFRSSGLGLEMVGRFHGNASYASPILAGTDANGRIAIPVSNFQLSL